MYIYHYAPQTGLLTERSTADLDPEESLRQKKDVYLIPAHATLDPVPALQSGQQARRVNNAWQVEQIPQPEVPPEPTDDERLAIAKAAKQAEIYQAYAAACSGSVDCTVGGKTYTMNAGEEHANRMFAGYTLAKVLFDLEQGPDTMTVTDFHDVDHSNVPLADAYSIAIQQGAHFAAQRRRKNDLRRQINGVQIPEGGSLADAQAELDLIVW